MITYDSQAWRTLIRLKGSVLPKAMVYAALPTILAGAVKFITDEGIFDFMKYSMIKESDSFKVFSWTLGFLLVFRTSQCYSRFWVAATGICAMRAQLYEACASLCVFVRMSKKPKEEGNAFKDKVVRLTSLLHALAMCVIGDLTNETFAIIDVESIPDKFIQLLHKKDGRNRVELVYAWLNTAIIHALDDGLLNVPPPILSRVFQELERAMVEYNQVMQIMTVPFPFPYAQVSVLGIMVYSLLCPFVMMDYTRNAQGAMIFTWISCTCFFSLELISAQLENPFGLDPNDLPCHSFQDDLNEGLILLLDPAADEEFYLGPTRHYEELQERRTWHSFAQLRIYFENLGRKRVSTERERLSEEQFDDYVQCIHQTESMKEIKVGLDPNTQQDLDEESGLSPLDTLVKQNTLANQQGVNVTPEPPGPPSTEAASKRSEKDESANKSKTDVGGVPTNSMTEQWSEYVQQWNDFSQRLLDILAKIHLRLESDLGKIVDTSASELLPRIVEILQSQSANTKKTDVVEPIVEPIASASQQPACCTRPV